MATSSSRKHLINHAALSSCCVLSWFLYTLFSSCFHPFFSPPFLLSFSLFLFFISTLPFHPHLPLSPLFSLPPSPPSSLCSIIGTPTPEQWPSESSITVSQFAQFEPKPWLQLLPEACQHAQDLLSVSMYNLFYVCLLVYKCNTPIYNNELAPA